MTLKTIFLFVILFFVIRFFIKFLLPIIAITRQTQRSIHDLKSQMEAMHQDTPNDQFHDPKSTPSTHTTTAQLDGDYIDFEEVK